MLGLLADPLPYDRSLSDRPSPLRESRDVSKALDRLAEAHGPSLGYVSEDGTCRRVSERAKRGVLAALGIAAETEGDVEASLSRAPSPVPHELAAPASARCFVPSWLENRRAWGIGDFEDLARLAECAGASQRGSRGSIGSRADHPALMAPMCSLARAPSRLIAVQLEDLLGVAAQANLPGTVNDHPNWRRKLPISLEDFAGAASFGKVVQAMTRERRRYP